MLFVINVYASLPVPGLIIRVVFKLQTFQTKIRHIDFSRSASVWPKLYWVVTKPALSSLATPEVVGTTTSGAVSDDKVCLLTPAFQWTLCECINYCAPQSSAYSILCVTNPPDPRILCTYGKVMWKGLSCNFIIMIQSYDMSLPVPESDILILYMYTWGISGHDTMSYTGSPPACVASYGDHLKTVTSSYIEPMIFTCE